MNRSKQKVKKQQTELLLQIEEAKQRLQTLLMNLEYVTDPELMDCLIYELKAVQGKYQYLLKIAKTYHLTCDQETLQMLQEESAV